MSENTNIEWCDATFNPWEGCTKVSPGCDHCYAETRNARFGGGQAVNWGPGAPRRRTGKDTWAKPEQWQKRAADFMTKHGRRQRVFCASLADVFDNQVPAEWRVDLFRLIKATPDLDWLLLTKRIGMVTPLLLESLKWSATSDPDLAYWIGCWFDGHPPANVWIGGTITSQEEADRDIPKLLAVPARVRFLSMEPLLGPVDITDHLWGRVKACAGCPADGDCDCGFYARSALSGESALNWVIVGGESGPGARAMHPDWARSLRDQCAAAGVPFLFKQWGEWGPFVNEAHYTHGGAEQHAHAWVDAETADHGLCWIVDDDGLWSNWTGEPRKLPEGEEDDQGGNLRASVTVMGHHGKKAAGRLLDGAQHDGFPGTTP